MSSHLTGILIIIAIIALGLSTGGDIFNGAGTNTDPTSKNTYSLGESGGGTRPYGSNFQEMGETANASIHKDKVTIDNVNNRGTFNEYVNLSTDLDDGEEVMITGWRIRSAVTGREMIIGGAANIPIVGMRDQSPITLSADAKVVVSTGHSPIGTSFRINKCAGYLEQKRNFQPSVRTRCPAIIDDAPPLSRGINDDCLDYIERLPRCEIPSERDFPNNLTVACKNFLKTEVGYENCVANHAADPDFYEQEWRVYTGLGGIITREKRENIQLLDNFGRVVDAYAY